MLPATKTCALLCCPAAALRGAEFPLPFHPQWAHHRPPWLHRASPPPCPSACPPAESTGALYRRWYEVLAPHFCKSWEASERLLALCRQLWGQPFTAPTYALLLYQWLLVHREAGGADQRLKHLNVLFSGKAGRAGQQAGRQAGGVGTAAVPVAVCRRTMLGCLHTLCMYGCEACVSLARKSSSPAGVLMF